MFGKIKKDEKVEEKSEKSVDNGGGFVVIYSSAQGTALEREPERARENLENDTERMEETTVNSEMSFA